MGPRRRALLGAVVGAMGAWSVGDRETVTTDTVKPTTGVRFRMGSGTGGQTPVEQVVDAASQWPEVALGPHPYDGVEFLLDDYEFGHVHHGWRSLHVNYPRRLRDTLIEEGRIARHPHFSNSGWTSYRLRSGEDVDDALWLLRVSYLYRSLTRRRKPAGQAVLGAVDVPAELDALDVSEQVRTVFEDVAELDSTPQLEL